MNTQKTSAGQLTELLQKLSDKEPAVCRRVKFDRCKIGEYEFGFYPSGMLYAMLDNNIVAGPAALDWLAGAVMRECEAREWYVLTERLSGISFVKIKTESERAHHTDAADLSTALIAAFVAAVEATAISERKDK